MGAKAMTLADIFVKEADKLEGQLAPGHAHILKIGRELASRYNANLETLSGITGDYVKTYHELDALKGSLKR
jgi:hypothetical protein